MRKERWRLNIDRGFRDLVRPLSKTEYIRLENQVLQGTCREEVVSWNGLVLQGFELYSICSKHHLPFFHDVKAFECREDAISWVCRHELQSPRLTEERRRFLIGVCYNAECEANRYHREHALPGEKIPFVSGKVVAKDLSQTFHAACPSVKKYERYSSALLDIRSVCRPLFLKIVSGSVKLSREAVFDLSKMDGSKIEAFYQAVAGNHLGFPAARKVLEDIMKD